MTPVKRVVAIYLFVFLVLCSLAISAEDSAPITAILGAFGDEVEMLEGKLADSQEQRIEGIRFVIGKMKDRPVVVAQSGVGKVNAAMTTTLLIEHFRPNEVIFTGVAGGINPDLLPGDIVIATKTAQHDLGSLTSNGIENWGVRNPIDGKRNPTFFPADARLLNLAETSVRRVELEKIQTSQGERMPRVIKGVVVTGDVFVASGSKKQELREALQADAVEMEGAAVAQICWQRGVPCLVIRSLSDVADANADQDYEIFYKIAARNSAKLVAEIVEHLGSAPSLEKDTISR